MSSCTCSDSASPNPSPSPDPSPARNPHPPGEAVLAKLEPSLGCLRQRVGLQPAGRAICAAGLAVAVAGALSPTWFASQRGFGFWLAPSTHLRLRMLLAAPRALPLHSTCRVACRFPLAVPVEVLTEDGRPRPPNADDQKQVPGAARRVWGMEWRTC